MAGSSSRHLVVTLAAATLLLLILAGASAYKDIPIGTLTRDPVQVADVHPLTGFLSNFGVLLWCASAATCLFSSVLLYHVQRTTAALFLFCSALLTLALLLDDFFLLHEYFARKYLGIQESAVHAMLGVATAAYLLGFRRMLLQTQFAALVLAVLFLTASVGADSIFQGWLHGLGRWSLLVEDGAKFMGIACWCNYYVRVSYQTVAASPAIASL